MRIKSLLVVAVICLLSISSVAEEKGADANKMVQKTFSATINPLGLLLNSISGKFAVQMFDNIALTIPVAVYYSGYYSTNAFPVTWGIAAGVGAKISIGSPVMETGWFVEPQMLLGFSQTLSGYNSFFMVPGVMGGYSWVWDNGFTLNAAGGFIVAIQSYNQNVSANIWPQIEVSLGYTW